MINRMFTVFDSKASTFCAPFCFGQMGEATRAFSQSANEPGHPFNLHPEDYTLFFLGIYDGDTAKFDVQNSPEALGNALQFKLDPSDLPLEAAIKEAIQ